MNDRVKELEIVLGEALTLATLNIIPDEAWIQKTEKLLFGAAQIWELPPLPEEEKCRNCGHDREDHTAKFVVEGKIEWGCTKCECGCNKYLPPLENNTQAPALGPN